MRKQENHHPTRKPNIRIFFWCQTFKTILDAFSKEKHKKVIYLLVADRLTTMMQLISVLVASISLAESIETVPLLHIL